MANYNGIPYGQKGLTASFQTLVDGLTTSRYLTVNPLSTNRGDIVIAVKGETGSGAGFQLEPADAAVTLDLQGDNSRYVAKCTVLGTTISYIGHAGAGE